MQCRIYITVILPLRLEWNPYYYVLPDPLCDKECPVKRGDRVRVMVSGKYYIGVVYEVGVKPVIPESKIREITRVESLDHVSEEEIRLWDFISDYYMCTIGEVYKAAYPIGRVSEEQIGENIRLRKETRKKKLIESLKLKIETIETRIGKKRELLEKAEASKRPNPEKIEFLKAQLKELESSKNSINEELRSMETNRKPELNPEQDLAHNPVSAPAHDSAQSQSFSRIELSEEQYKAKNAVTVAFEKGKVALLDGVTGSGKTEIYCSLGEETLRNGRNVLYLVPEIALSRQLEARLEKVFGETLLVSHSGETYARRREVSFLMKERPYVLLGTRSSIFLPHNNLGLIIVDEEHDTSYKQDSPSPRYNGRDCALVMGRIFNCPVILGSATPSLESLYNCASGRYSHIKLKTRFYQGDDAEIEIIDTIAERRKRGMVGSLSRKLIAHVFDTLERGEQAVILRGRKAYSPIVQCDSCGDIPKCPHCNVTLSYHKDKNRLVCHYCGYFEPYVSKCPTCGGNRIPMGSGTQKIEEEIASLFPNARVARLDGDNAPGSTNVIKDFEQGKTDILVGTQMVSKGFDFEKLTLVAVVQSDSLFSQQDFRADERAIQLLEQLRGRSGRRGRKSLFVIQTSQPDHPVYRRLSDLSEFSEGELSLRRDYGFPPYTRIITLILKDSNLPRLEKLSSGLSMATAQAFGTSPSVVSSGDDAPVHVSFAYAPVIDRQSDEYIRHIRVTMNRNRYLAKYKKTLSEAVSAYEKKVDWTGHISIDVDPI